MVNAGCTNFSTTGDEWNDPDLPLLDHWSADGRSYQIVRNNRDTVLRSGKEITITLNPQPCGDYGYRAAGPGGELLGAYSFTFTIGDGDASLFAVPADPAQGFEWPYYLGLPPALVGRGGT